MKAFYHDLFTFPLPQDHRFPISKYALLRDRIQASEHKAYIELTVSDAATDEQLLLVHTPEYLEKITQGKLSKEEERRLGFPWSPQLVERSRRSVGSTLQACRAALEEGAAVNLAGGTHHAFAGHAEGFCVFNDVAAASRWLQRENPELRILVVDCDVHQGNGTASILKQDPNTFIFSIHGEKNFPFRKVPGDLDIGLPDGTGDEAYLEALGSGIDQALERFSPHMMIYLAGADPYSQDRLGRLALTKQGLAERDQIVINTCRQRRIPVALVMGGGYAKDINDIVDIHYNSVAATLDYFISCKISRP